MALWWQSLSPTLQVFYVIASLATLVLVLRMILGAMGIDHSVDVDVSGSTGHGSGLGLFSLQTIATFFVGFGWVGVVWLTRGHALIWALLAGLLVGSGLVAGMLFVMRSLLRLQDSGTLDYHNAVGSVGVVYCPIPPGRAPGGQVEVLIQGRTVFADALTESPAELKTGARVRVTSVSGQSILFVEPL